VLIDVERLLVPRHRDRPPSLVDVGVGVHHGFHGQRLDIDYENRQLGGFADGQRETADRHCVREHRAGDADVDGTVEVGAVCSVDLTPSAVPVRAQPEVGLGQIAEQHELAHLPHR
jgi:hypothetical protein